MNTRVLESFLFLVVLEEICWYTLLFLLQNTKNLPIWWEKLKPPLFKNSNYTYWTTNGFPSNLNGLFNLDEMAWCLALDWKKNIQIITNYKMFLIRWISFVQVLLTISKLCSVVSIRVEGKYLSSHKKIIKSNSRWFHFQEFQSITDQSWIFKIKRPSAPLLILL